MTGSMALESWRGAVTENRAVWFMRQAGRYLPEYMETRAVAGDFLTLCYTPDLACEVTLQPIRRFGFDASIIFSDILVVPHALGQKLWFETGEGPRLDPLKNLDTLGFDSFSNHLAPVYEAVRKTRSALPQDTALIGFAGAPWTVAAYMIDGKGGGFPKACGLAQAGDAMLEKLCDLLVEASIRHLVSQIEAGAQAVQLFESWAGLLDGAAFDRFVIQPNAAIVAAIKKTCPGVPVICFPRGKPGRLADFVAGVKPHAVSIGQDMPMIDAVRAVPPEICLQGNLDPALLVKGGQDMVDACDAILGAARGRAFVFNLGHGIDKTTPIAHVRQVVDHVHNRKA